MNFEVEILQIVFQACIFVLCFGTHHASDSLCRKQPLNIAHRGSSGVFPEHTEPAYRQAIRDGADVIECDVTVTRDLKLVCRHDLWLSQTTNVQDLTEFKSRQRSRVVPTQRSDGDIRNVTDWFVIDFTLAELKTLKMRQGKKFRDQTHNDLYDIVALEEFIAIAQDSERPIGIYPELKHTTWTNNQIQGPRFEDLVLEVLHSSGYTEATSPKCILQSFGADCLQYLSERTTLPLVLLSDNAIPDSTLTSLAPILYGLGLKKSVLLPEKTLVDPTSSNMVSTLQKLDLQLHVFTMKDDEELAMDVCMYETPHEEYELLVKLGVDGFFTDFPQTLNSYLDQCKDGL